jgi:hypothetical protein
MKVENIPVISWDIYSPDDIDKNVGNTIAISDKIYYKMINELTEFNPLYVEITKTDESGFNQSNCRCLLFGNIISVEQDVIVLPYWAMAKYGLEPFQNVTIENVDNLQNIDYIQVRANNSDYVHWSSLKELLEETLIKCRAISLGDMINVHGIEFYVCQIKNQSGSEILDGSLYNTDVKIDFDVPVDILEEERLQKIKNEEQKIKEEEQERLRQLKYEEETMDRIREKNRLRMIEESKNKIFAGTAYKLDDGPSQITREQMAEIIKARINKNMAKNM